MIIRLIIGRGLDYYTSFFFLFEKDYSSFLISKILNAFSLNLDQLYVRFCLYKNKQKRILQRSNNFYPIL